MVFWLSISFSSFLKGVFKPDPCSALGPKIRHPTAAMSGTVAVVQENRLFVSEPNPRWFGNSPNPSDTKAEALTCPFGALRPP